MGASPGIGEKELLPLPRPAETRMGSRAAERRARPILRPFFDVTITVIVLLYCQVMGIYSEQCDVQANGGRVKSKGRAQLSLLFLCTSTRRVSLAETPSTLYLHSWPLSPLRPRSTCCLQPRRHLHWPSPRDSCPHHCLSSLDCTLLAETRATGIRDKGNFEL
jgi:hypothetical protein